MYWFGVTIFLSAFLLFQVQPLISKRILPWFGGSPAVWTTCMLFFQVLLLCGYAYAHLLTTRLSQRRQVVTHLAVLGLGIAALPLLFLPLYLGGAWKPASPDWPTVRILLLLAVTVGVPYFALSSTSPLLQKWLVTARPGKRVYRLFALSNVGSLLALLSFPFVMEPLFSTRKMAIGWSAGFIAFALLCARTGLAAFRAPLGGLSGDPPPAAAPMEERVPPIVWLLWLSLPACASVMLLAVTNKICQDVAVVPFLWVLPLTLYLLSFIICFDSDRWYFRPVFWPLMAAGVACMCWMLTAQAGGGDLDILWQIAGYALGLFVCSMVCHGELVRLRPGGRHLTAFYLMVAAGGALGGVFVALVAPLIFKTYAELNLGIWLSAAAALAALAYSLKLASRRSGTFHRPAVYLRRVGIPLAAIGLVPLGVVLARNVSIMQAACFRISRNFYGVLRVFEDDKNDPELHSFTLVHGRICHGKQYTGSLRRKPMTYFGEGSGVGLAMRLYPGRQAAIRVGILGLGAATLAAYGRQGDVFRFYEINSEVVALARDPFTYLADSAAKCEIVMGDARLSLEREPSQQFDILILDAFSGDAIPVHLLTQEAFQIYLRHLKPGGIIAVNISNWNFDLQPVVAGLADRANLRMVSVQFEPAKATRQFRSTWVLLTDNEQFLAVPTIKLLAKKTGGRRLYWTDDFSDLFSVLK